MIAVRTGLTQSSGSKTADPGPTIRRRAMALEEATIRYLESQGKGRLATIGRDGRPQNKPVGYRYNADLGTIDISGFNMDTSAKYKNIVTHPDVSFVVDDAIGEGAENMRMLEI